MKMYHQFQVFHWKSDDQQMGFAAISTSARAPLRFALASSFVYSFLMGHDLIDRRSLELNRLVAEKIRRQPELMDLVRNRLERTLSESRLSESSKDALREWQTILSTHSLNEVLEILTEDSDEGRRLRQSSPFSGILSQRERFEIFRRYESAGT
jgi:hypothetical protein